jgi:succinoglycan biosynthesis protein ExoM
MSTQDASEDTERLASGGRKPQCSVLVAAPTYKRNALLETLLDSLSRLDVPSGSLVRVVIIDNDLDQRARPVVEAWQERFPIPLIYEAEPAPGVTHVRNRALDLASEDEFLAFIDDDEFAEPQWLAELLRRQEETGAAAVFGPVKPIYPDTAPDWMRRWGVHGTPIPADSFRTKPGATNNCLIAMDVVRATGLRFASEMSLTGGEDTLFFRQLLDRGYTLANAMNAHVSEHVPAERARAGWLLKRWYRTGVTDALIDGRLLPAPLSRLRALLHGSIRLVAGGALAALAAIFTLGQGRRLILSRCYTASRGLGMLAYAFGRRYEEYGRGEVRPAT